MELALKLLGLFFFIFVATSVFAESFILYRLRHQKVTWDWSEFFQKTRGPRALPKMVVVRDPESYLGVVRSLGNRGLIFVSKGMLSQVTEAELRQELKRASQANQKGRVYVDSIVSAWIAILSFFLPRALLRKLFFGEQLTPRETVGPIQALSYSVLFSLFEGMFAMVHRPEPLKRLLSTC